LSAVSDVDQTYTIRFSVYGIGLASIILVLALCVLIGGWTFHLPAFRRIIPGYAAMVPSTALSFMGVSIAIILAFRARQSDETPVAIRVLAALVGAVAIFDLLVIGLTASNGIDQFIHPTFEGFRSDSMAIATATSFALAAICLLRLERSRLAPDLVFTTCATIGLALSAIALTGYAFDTAALYEISLFTAMALHTALAFLVMFACLLMLRPHTGWMAILTGRGGGSESARRLIPVVIGLPFVLCLLALWATQSGLVDFNFRLSLLAIVMMALLSSSVFRRAYVQNRIEAELRSTINDRELLLREVFHRVKNNLQMTTSLLRMGQRQTDDPEALSTLATTIKRVEAIGNVHRILISAPVPSNVRASEFIDEVVPNIIAGLVSAGQIDLIDVKTDVGDFTLHIDKAVTIGLLINELLTNALQHAYPRDGRGQVRISFHKSEDGSAVLELSDRGVGFDAGTAQGDGLRITEALVGQLRARWTVSHQGGTAHRIEIPAFSLDGAKHD